MDTARLKENFGRVAAHGDEVILFFYSHLFLTHPEVRDFFPMSMSTQRDRLFRALGRVVSNVDDPNTLVPFLRQLGRDHRKFDTLADHYPAVGASLLETLKHFSGPEWSPDLAADWASAYGLVSSVMIEAADQDATQRQAVWDATVVAHERRTADIAVIRLRPEQPFHFVPGESVSLQTEHRPRLWRWYSIANAPRPDGTLDFHIRVVDGGAVSLAMVQLLRVGEPVRLGPPIGRLTRDRGSDRDLLLVGGGTGLAPLKAVVEELVAGSQRRRTHLFFGARHPHELYDLPALEALAGEHPWLTVVPAVSHNELYQGERGTLAEVIGRFGSWLEHDIHVCGPPTMVETTMKRLAQAGVPEERVRFDEFGGYDAVPDREVIL